MLRTLSLHQPSRHAFQRSRELSILFRAESEKAEEFSILVPEPVEGEFALFFFLSVACQMIMSIFRLGVLDASEMYKLMILIQ
jgi:hypothetical protein